MSHYLYDDYNNRKTMNANGIVSTYEYYKNNRLVKQTKIEGNTTEVTSYSYDNNGNQIYRDKQTIEPVQLGQTAEFSAYVVGKKPNSTTAKFIYVLL